MKIWVLILATLLCRMATAQSNTLQPWVPGLVYESNMAHPFFLRDSSLHSKWSVSKYMGMSAGYSFFKGGSASVISAPIALQLNRRLTNNLYAFAGVAAAPSYINFNSTFIPSTNKSNQSFFTKSNLFDVHPKAELGLMYINDAKTFSISGSIGVERSTMPLYYSTPVLPRPNAAFLPNK